MYFLLQFTINSTKDSNTESFNATIVKQQMYNQRHKHVKIRSSYQNILYFREVNKLKIMG